TETITNKMSASKKVKWQLFDPKTFELSPAPLGVSSFLPSQAFATSCWELNPQLPYRRPYVPTPPDDPLYWVDKKLGISNKDPYGMAAYYGGWQLTQYPWE